jgi:hypothetical protein
VAERPAGQVPMIEGSKAFLAWCGHLRDHKHVPFVQATQVDGKWCRGFHMPTLFPPRGDDQDEQI